MRCCGGRWRWTRLVQREIRGVDYVEVCGHRYRHGNRSGGIRRRLQCRAGAGCGNTGPRNGIGNCCPDTGPYPDNRANRYAGANLDASTHLDANAGTYFDAYPNAGADLDAAAYLYAGADGYAITDADAPTYQHALANTYAMADGYSGSSRIEL